ncbi:MAG: SRPBCC family protein [Pseudomonadota bacterium]
MNHSHCFNPKLDLMFERVVDIAPELVWRAWTEPQHIVKWFTPKPWQTPECEIDLRPGGRFYTVMQSPEGERVAGASCYLEIVPNRKLVWTSALEPGYRPIAPKTSSGSCADFLFTAVIMLEPVSTGKSTGTKYTAMVIHADEESRKQHEAMGFEEGWGAALDQLVEHMKAQ